jgi:hypothetical protein
MHKYINKKSPFKAIQFIPENFSEIRKFVGENLLMSVTNVYYIKRGDYAMPLEFGCWICEVRGEPKDFTIVDDESFKNTYKQLPYATQEGNIEEDNFEKH